MEIHRQSIGKSNVYCRSTLGEAECIEIHRKSIGKDGVRELCTKIPTFTANPLWERQNVWKYIEYESDRNGSDRNESDRNESDRSTRVIGVRK